MAGKSTRLGGLWADEEVTKLLPGLLDHTVRHDHAVTMLRIALEAKQADRLAFRQRDCLAEIEEGLWLLHML